MKEENPDLFYLIQKLISALEFYADSKNYQNVYAPGGTGYVLVEESKITRDLGKQANEALDLYFENFLIAECCHEVKQT